MLLISDAYVPGESLFRSTWKEILTKILANTFLTDTTCEAHWGCAGASIWRWISLEAAFQVIASMYLPLITRRWIHCSDLQSQTYANDHHQSLGILQCTKCHLHESLPNRSTSDAASALYIFQFSNCILREISEAGSDVMCCFACTPTSSWWLLMDI